MTDNCEIELQTRAILDRMQERGIRVDTLVLEQEMEKLTNRLTDLGQELNSIVGMPINPASRKQVAEYLFEILKLKATPKRSVAQQYLTHFDIPFKAPYFEWSTVRRTLSLIESSIAFIHGGRLYTHWNHTNETSGRIYCSDFNVQQLPVIGRRALVPDPGNVFLLLDYDQIELRVLATLANAQSLIDMFNSSIDVHTATAALMLGIPPEEVTAAQRDREGKTFNYGLSYGMEADGLAQRLGLPKDAAQQLIDTFFARMPEVRRYIIKVQRDAQRDGYVTNPFGHRRELADWSAKAKTGRQAINTLIQGTAASILKRALIRVSSLSDVEIMATVHDSILVQIPRDGDKTQEVVSAMETQLNGLSFPITFAVGSSWGAAQEAL